MLPEAVLSTVPTKNLVAVDASVLTKAAEVAVPDKFPLNVVAVMVLPSAEIPVSTYTAVPANPAFDLVPKRYKVLVVSAVVATNIDELAIEAVPVKLPLKVVAVIVFPKADTPDKTYTGVEPIEALLLEPVKYIVEVVSRVTFVLAELVAVVAVPLKVVAVMVLPSAEIPVFT